MLKRFVIDSSQLMVLLLNASTSKVLYTLIGTLVKIAYHIGPDATTERLVPYLDQFFSQYFDLGQESTKTGIHEIYTPEMAGMLYYQFAILIGKDRLDEEISNIQKIQAVMKKDDRLNLFYQNLSSDDFTPVHPSPNNYSGPFVEAKAKMDRILDNTANLKDDTRTKVSDPNWLLNSISEPNSVNTWGGNFFFFFFTEMRWKLLKSIHLSICHFFSSVILSN